eukprot:3124245-Karenia_brevis.AAC.1
MLASRCESQIRIRLDACEGCMQPPLEIHSLAQSLLVWLFNVFLMMAIQMNKFQTFLTSCNGSGEPTSEPLQ